MHRSPPQRLPHLFADLNGWRRIGVVLVFVWLVIAGTVLWRMPEVAADVFPMLADPVVGTRLIPAPELKEELEAAKVKQLGRALAPWEMEWNPMREVPVHLPAEVSPLTRWLLLFSVPLLTWHVVELVVRVVLWVRVGFTSDLDR